MQFPPRTSPAERAFMEVYAIQDAIQPKEARSLARVCSTLKAVADDPELWRRALTDELVQDRWALRFPLDADATTSNDQSEVPYKQIYRGFRIIDGLSEPVVSKKNRDEGQREAVDRAEKFIRLNFPGLHEAILARHSIYAQHLPPSYTFELARWTAFKKSFKSAGLGAVSTGMGIGAYAGYKLTRDSVAALYGAKAISAIAFVATKTTLVLVPVVGAAVTGSAALEAASLGIAAGRSTIRLIKRNRLVRTRKIAATSIQAHLLKNRVKMQIKKLREGNTEAGLNQIQQPKMLLWHEKP